jgi:hypothetical protein
MEANMSRVPKIAHVQRWLVRFFGERSEKIRIRNAFADAQRAQAARLFAQQVSPYFDDGMNLPRKGRNFAVGG